MRSVPDNRARAFLSDQRRKLADVDTVAGLGEWRDDLVAASRRRGDALSDVLGTRVVQLSEDGEHARIQLAGYLAEWRRLVAATLRRMQVSGQLRPDADPDELATGLIAAAQGGYVRTQTSRDADHMAAAIDMALARVRFFTGP